MQLWSLPDPALTLGVRRWSGINASMLEGVATRLHHIQVRTAL